MIKRSLLPLLTLSLFLGPILARAVFLDPSSTPNTAITSVLVNNPGVRTGWPDESWHIYDASGTFFLDGGSGECGTGSPPVDYIIHDTITTLGSHGITDGWTPGSYTFYFIFCGAGDVSGNCGAGHTFADCVAAYPGNPSDTLAVSGPPPPPTIPSVQGFIDDYGTPLIWLLAGIVFLGIALGIMELIKAGQELWHRRVL